MSVQEIETAIRQLKPAELEELARWFAEFHADLWDRQIEADAMAGRFDSLIAEARADFKAGRTRPL